MLPVIDEYRPRLSGSEAWLGASQAVLDAAASMSAWLGGEWEVERVVDPFSQVSIILLPVRDDTALPTFILYEKDGLPRIATIRDDVWESDQVFSVCPQDVAAILAASRRDQESRCFARPTLGQCD